MSTARPTGVTQRGSSGAETDAAAGLHSSPGMDARGTGFFWSSIGRHRPSPAGSQAGDLPAKKALWKRARQTLGRFGRSEVGGRAKQFLALLIACMLAINGLNVVNSYVGRDFISAVEARNMPEFLRVSLVYLLVFGACTVMAVLYRFVEERLGLLWREWQTKEIMERYLWRRTYLQLASDKELGNPDQRIAEDVRTFATTSLSFLLMTMNGVFTVIAFSGVMWSISPLLLGGAAAYALAGSLMTILLGRRLVGLNYAQADREAGFRVELLHVREHAVENAMLRHESRLRDRLSHRFGEVVSNARHLIAVNRNVSFFTTGYNYLVPVIPVFVVAHLFMRGQVEFGVVTQSANAFAQLMGAFSLIVTQFQSMYSYAAVIARIRGLTDAMNAAAERKQGRLTVAEGEGLLAYEHVTLLGPGGCALVRDLNLVIPTGSHVLIRTETSRARFALLRATAGLWTDGEGSIIRPSGDRLTFLPERPSLAEGTLRELLVKPEDAGTVTTAQIEETLQALGLADLPGQSGGLDAHESWSEVLSLDEQALLAVARMLLAAPEFVILDRLGTSLDKPRLALVFAALKARGISYAALGRMGDEAQGFDQVLCIAGDGTWAREKAVPDGIPTTSVEFKIHGARRRPQHRRAGRQMLAAA